VEILSADPDAPPLEKPKDRVGQKAAGESIEIL
jgi:hypothetical protein